MGTVDEIVIAIDNHLLQNGKQYLSLGQANQLLFNLGLISDSEKQNQTLKRLLKENKIPHAYQTIHSPRQWRIPISNKNKNRNKKRTTTTTNKTPVKSRQLRPYYDNPVLIDNDSNHTICPGCGIDLSIPDNLLKYPYIKCLTCGVDFKNPFKVNQKESTKVLTKKQRNWIIAIAVFIVLFIIGVISEKNHPDTFLYYINQTTYAATSKDSYDKMINCIDDHDDQAISSLILYGEIMTLPKGTDIYLENAHVSYSVVRLKGSTQNLWIMSEYMTQR